MVSLDKAVVARMKRGEHHFEVLVDPDAAEKLTDKWREGKATAPEELRSILATDYVFTHWSDGKKASDEELTMAFETTDLLAIARRILTEGEVQLTAEQRKKMGEAKHKRVVEVILRNGWNPQTKTPHPKDRIERALEEAKFKVDPLRRTEEQIEVAMKLLRPLLPIAFEKVKVAIRIPAEHTGHTYGPARAMGEIQQEEWQNDGSLILVLEIPAGMQTEVYDRLNGLTHGQVTTKLVS
ncbi:MAG TPA: ribosome assembly factor SBDS [Candidatus Thermoplasmatota archaeon]|nr:ribosome assembly factor SBDS [Candidatus Thermoplasmatota archaeon]